MEKINYKELYELEDKRVFIELEKKALKIFLSFKKKGKVFDSFYNRLLTILNKFETEKYYIKVSGKYGGIINDFDNKYGYDSICEHVIYSHDMYKDFKRVKGVKKNYGYIDFLKELAKIKVYNRVYKACREFYDTYEMMYEFNDFFNFKIWNIDEVQKRDPVYIDLINRKFPKTKEEIETLIYNFKLKRKYKDNFKLIYDDLTVSFINEEKTTQKDFENVFQLKSNEHKSKIYFFGETKSVAYLLRKLECFFEDLNFTNISNSELFKSKGNNPLRQKSLSNSLTAFNKRIGTTDVDKVIQEVECIFNKIK